MRKNSSFALVFTVILAVAASSCRYGEQEAAESIKRNQDYKIQKAADAPAPIDPNYIKPAESAADGK